LGSVCGGCWATRAPDPPTSIDIVAQRLPAFDHTDSTRRQFGLLEFRGGLVLTASFKHFGGLSAIRVQPDGANFIAASDRGWWLKGRIVYDGNRPSAIADAQMAPILGPDGLALSSRGWYDTESIAQDGGTLYVGIERVNRIVRFDFGKDGVLARGQPIDVPPGCAACPTRASSRSSLCRGADLSGTLIAISERGLTRDGNLTAFLIGGPRPGTFALRRTADYDVSDAALLPSGDLLVLERKFSWTTGLFVRIRRIAQLDIQPGALVDGRVLFEADLGYAIDNLEGLSVHRGPNGETVLTLVSDDNFSALQRTLLLQFTLAEP
jgi:hypothetical protein